jgi:hypothetical protein
MRTSIDLGFASSIESEPTCRTGFLCQKTDASYWEPISRENMPWNLQPCLILRSFHTLTKRT